MGSQGGATLTSGDDRSPDYLLGASESEQARLVSGILHTLAPALVAGGIATRDEMGLDTFHERFTQQVCSSRAVLLPPAVVGGWGGRPRGTLG